MRIRLKLTWNGRPKGAEIDIAPGLAKTLIAAHKAELVETKAADEPGNKRARKPRNKSAG